MIFLVWLLYFPALFLIGFLRNILAGMGIEIPMLPTVLLHGVLFFGLCALGRKVKMLLRKNAPFSANEKAAHGNLNIYGIVTVGFTAMLALGNNGMLTRAVSGYLIPICAYVVLAVSLNLVVGISGELSLGHAGFMGVGAFAGIVAATCCMGVIESKFLVLLIAMIVGGIFAGIFGVIVGVPVLRLRGDYLAIVTLAFGEIIKNIVNSMYIGLDTEGLHLWMDKSNAVLEEGGKMIISGSLGATGVQKISTFTAGFLLILFALAVVLNLINSKEGRAIKAVRDNRIAAESVGINVTAFRLKAFVVSAVLAGMAGALFGLNLGSLQASKFGYNTSIDILVYVVLGGMGNIFGSIISTVTLYLIPEFLRGLADLRMIIYAVVLIVVMLCTWSPKIKSFLQVTKAALSEKVKSVFTKAAKKEVSGNE